MSKRYFSLGESLWVLGEVIHGANRPARSETAALRERGARIFMLKGREDQESLQQLERILRQSDDHVILFWLLPREVKALYPLLRERKNFSIVADDWWIQPHWAMREAEYILFRKYQGIPVRSGETTFVSGPQPPWLYNPYPHIGTYSLIAALGRLPALAISPVVNACNYFRRRMEPIAPERYLFFPFPLDPGDVPLLSEKLEYDFANTGGSCGIWYIRDPHVSFHYTFANLYYDRKLLTDAIAEFEGNPFKFYDARREKKSRQKLPYDEYIRRNQQTRYLIATGGLQNTSVPKFLEYACVGTPMIGRALPFEYPWLDDCLINVDIFNLTPGRLKPLLHEALDRYPKMRENCLNWRDRLLKLYNVHNLLDMLQAQADGKPIPPGYLRTDASGIG